MTQICGNCKFWSIDDGDNYGWCDFHHDCYEENEEACPAYRDKGDPTVDCRSCQHSYTNFRNDNGNLVVRCIFGEQTSRHKECKLYECWRY